MNPVVFRQDVFTRFVKSALECVNFTRVDHFSWKVDPCPHNPKVVRVSLLSSRPLFMFDYNEVMVRYSAWSVLATEVVRQCLSVVGVHEFLDHIATSYSIYECRQIKFLVSSSHRQVWLPKFARFLKC